MKVLNTRERVNGWAPTLTPSNFIYWFVAFFFHNLGE